MHNLSLYTIWSWPRTNVINQLWLNISSTRTKEKIKSIWISSLHRKYCHSLATTVITHLHQHKMVVALQPLWLLTSHVYSVHSYKMYVAPAIIYMWIPTPYTVITHCIQNTDSQPLCILQPLCIVRGAYTTCLAELTPDLTSISQHTHYSHLGNSCYDSYNHFTHNGWAQTGL